MTPATLWHTSTPVPKRERPPKLERVATSSPELATLRSALDAIPNDTDPLDYDQWRNVVFAIHHATDGSDEGLALAHEFSARSGKYDPDFLDNRVWPYIGVNSAEPITERSLKALAEKHGWQDPTIADDFDVIEVTAEEKAAEKAARKRFEVIPEHEFVTGKPPAWLVKGVMPQAPLVVLFGESGSGKSFFAFDLTSAIARGLPWRGKRVKQGKVVYVVAEGASHFQNRVRAYKEHHGVERMDIGIIADAPNLMDVKEVKALTEAVQAYGPSVVVVDTFAQVTPGANENSGEDVGKALKHCKEIHRATGATIILVHHSGKDAAKGARGWSGLRAAADAEIEVSRCDDDRVATVTKMKDGMDGEEFGFRLNTVVLGEDEDGDDITSCVVEPAKVQPKEFRKAIKGANQKLVVDVLDDMMGLSDDEGIDHSALATAVSGNMEMPEEGKKDRRLEMARKAINSLVDAGVLVANGTRLKRVNS